MPGFFISGLLTTLENGFPQIVKTIARLQAFSIFVDSTPKIDAFQFNIIVPGYQRR